MSHYPLDWIIILVGLAVDTVQLSQAGFPTTSPDQNVNVLFRLISEVTNWEDQEHPTRSRCTLCLFERGRVKLREVAGLQVPNQLGRSDVRAFDFEAPDTATTT